MLRHLLRNPWLRRLFSALLGLFLGLAGLAGWSGWNRSSLEHLARDLQAAYDARDIKAMEALFCWEGVDERTRARIRLAILQEFELPVESVAIRPLLPTDGRDGPGLRPNLPPTAAVLVTYATPDHLSSAWLAGRQGLSGHRLIVMLPAN